MFYVMHLPTWNSDITINNSHRYVSLEKNRESRFLVENKYTINAIINATVSFTCITIDQKWIFMFIFIVSETYAILRSLMNAERAFR